MTMATVPSALRSAPLEKLPFIGMLVVILLAVVFNFAFLTRYPIAFIDEPWYAQAAWNWLTTGRNFDPMHSPARPATEWPYASTAPWAASFALLGLGFFQARLASWIFGVLLLMATVWVGRRSYGMAAGLLAALLLALSGPFLASSHYARPDVVVAAVVVYACGLGHRRQTEPLAVE